MTDLMLKYVKAEKALTLNILISVISGLFLAQYRSDV